MVDKHTNIRNKLLCTISLWNIIPTIFRNILPLSSRYESTLKFRRRLFSHCGILYHRFVGTFYVHLQGRRVYWHFRITCCTHFHSGTSYQRLWGTYCLHFQGTKVFQHFGNIYSLNLRCAILYQQFGGMFYLHLQPRLVYVYFGVTCYLHFIMEHCTKDFLRYAASFFRVERGDIIFLRNADVGLPNGITSQKFVTKLFTTMTTSGL
jgi:hypothetical protein